MRRLRLTLSGQRGLTVLACLALLAVAAASTMYSGASFTAITSNSGAAVGAGSLEVTSSIDGEAVIDVVDMRPGESRSATITLANQSTLEAPVALAIIDDGTTDSPEDRELSQALVLSIEDVTGGPLLLWSGPLRTLDTENLGTLATGESRTFRIGLSFPETNAVPRLQGTSTSIRLKFLEETL